MGDEIWILIPLAPFILGGFVIWSKHQQKMIEKQSEMTAEKASPDNDPFMGLCDVVFGFV